MARLDLLGHQADLVDDETSPVLVLKGGLRSGKTVAAVVKSLRMAQAAWPKPVLLCEPTYQMLRDVFVETARDLLGRLGVPYDWHRTDHILTVYPSSPRPLRIFCRSLDRPERMVGITVGGAIVDEWESCTEEGIIRVRERITPGVGETYTPQLVLVGTPEGFGFGYEWCEASPLPGLRLITARTADNVFVGASYVDTVRQVLTDGEARERLDGVRTAKAGTVYSRFTRSRHCGGPCLDDGELFIAADFNVSMMAWAFVLVDKAGNRAHVVGELIGRNTDTLEQSERAADWIADWYSRRDRRHRTRDDVRRMQIPVVCDASGASRSAVVPLSHVALLLQAGFRPQYPASNPRVEDRIASVQLLLAQTPAQMTIDPVAAPYVARCLESQPYDASGRPDKSAALGLDHGADALGYLVHWLWPTWAPRGNAPSAAPRRRRA